MSNILSKFIFMLFVVFFVSLLVFFPIFGFIENIIEGSSSQLRLALQDSSSSNSKNKKDIN